MLTGWVALTGTPGVGKTTVADRLRLTGVPNVELGRFAHDYDLVDGVDSRRMTTIVDPARIPPVLARLVQKGALLLLEGHWSHEVPGVSAAIVLRLRPTELRGRLERRGWPEAKVRENLEAEAIDIVLQEAVQRLGARRVFEVDASGRSTDAVAHDVQRILRGSAPVTRAFRPGRVDWSGELPGHAPE